MGDTVGFSCIKKRETDKAMQVENNGIQAWIPKSQIEKLTTEDGEKYVLFVPQWLYIDKFEDKGK